MEVSDEGWLGLRLDGLRFGEQPRQPLRGDPEEVDQSQQEQGAEVESDPTEYQAEGHGAGSLPELFQFVKLDLLPQTEYLGPIPQCIRDCSSPHLHVGNELLHPFVHRLERVLAQHRSLGLVVQLEMHPVDRIVAAALLGVADELPP